MKIHIMGASCAGSTTLGTALAKQLNCTYLDTDAYYFVPSDIPYSIRREPAERIAMMKADFEAHEHVIVGGSLVSWANGYDDNSTNGRNLSVHQEWLSKVNCVVLKIEGDTTVVERLERVVKTMKNL